MFVDQQEYSQRIEVFYINRKKCHQIFSLKHLEINVKNTSQSDKILLNHGLFTF
jgi:hypothetical protein